MSVASCLAVRVLLDRGASLPRGVKVPGQTLARLAQVRVPPSFPRTWARSSPGRPPWPAHARACAPPRDVLLRLASRVPSSPPSASSACPCRSPGSPRGLPGRPSWPRRRRHRRARELGLPIGGPRAIPRRSPRAMRVAAHAGRQAAAPSSCSPPRPGLLRRLRPGGPGRVRRGGRRRGPAPHAALWAAGAPGWTPRCARPAASWSSTARRDAGRPGRARVFAGEPDWPRRPRRCAATASSNASVRVACGGWLPKPSNRPSSTAGGSSPSASRPTA